ncbi:MAG: hypothetical protein C0404_07740 [Verrucomicrobia bacterium]|nr:hypothetical protein [Verrucomicrobiota bacterium]
MHIPDGYLDARTALATATLAAAGVALALRSAERHLPPRRVPLIGLTAAFVFAAQLLNFPVLGGTSGHLMGAVLAAVLLGPAAAVLVMTAVLVLQALVFADGGITTLGANLFNMALVAPVAGHGVYRLTIRLAGNTSRGRLAATAFAAWCSTLLASAACAAELALSHTAAWDVVFPAMTGIHMLIAVGEALITTLVVRTILIERPGLVGDQAGSIRTPMPGGVVVQGILVAIVLAAAIAPFACSWPDGLEKVASTLGFEHKATRPLLTTPFADYRIPWIVSPAFSTAVAGAAGTLLAFFAAHLLARRLARNEAAK